MTPQIIIAIIGAFATIVGVIITNLTTNKKIEQQIQINQAVQDTKIDELTREVRLHNNFAQKIPVLEQRLDYLEKQLN